MNPLERIPWFPPNSKLNPTPTSSSKTISHTRTKSSNWNKKMPKPVHNYKNPSLKTLSSEWQHRKKNKKSSKSTIKRFPNLSENLRKFSKPNKKCKASTISTLKNWCKNTQSKWRAARKVSSRQKSFSSKNYQTSRATCLSIKKRSKNNTSRPASASLDLWNKSMSSTTLSKNKESTSVSSRNQTRKWLRSLRISKNNSSKQSKALKRHNSKYSRSKKIKTRLSSNSKAKISHYVMVSRISKAKSKSLIDLCPKNKTNSQNLNMISSVWENNLMKRPNLTFKRIFNSKRPKLTENNLRNKLLNYLKPWPTKKKTLKI